MTQTASAPPPPQPQQRPQSSAAQLQAIVGTPAPAPSQGALRFAENVPALLNRLQAIAVAACLVFGIVAAVLQVLSWQAAGRAADNTEQVVRVQQIQSLLLRADAIATNSYLSDGLEPAEARAQYDDALSDVLRLITDAADAQPADRAVLADLNDTVSAYATSVTQARDYNRQQQPIGIAYLNDAGTTLRTEAQPILTALVDANSERAVDEMEGQHPYWLMVLGLVALAVLWWVNRQVARRFKRRFNVGLLVAAVTVGVVMVVTGSYAVIKNSDDRETRDGAYTEAVDEAIARTAASNAKAYESLGLVNRGSGGSVYEPLFQKQSDIVIDEASNQTRALWETYLAQHDEVRAADDAGDWDEAVAMAIATGPDTATSALDAVDANAAATIDSAGVEAADGFRHGGALSVGLAIATLFAALVAAAAATRGIDVRRREYS